MADPTDDGTQPAYNAQGVRQVRSGTPGFSGAIGDLVAALAKAWGPGRTLSQRGAKIDQAVDEQSGSPQTNDLGSQF